MRNKKRSMQQRIKVITIPRRATVRDYAIAAARNSPNIGRNNFGPLTDDYSDQPWLGGSTGGEYSDEPWMGPYGNIGEGTTDPPASKGSGWSKILDIVTKNADKIVRAGKSDSSAGKSAGNILAGLGESYVSDVVKRYKRGDSLSEFERRVAEAAISLERTAKEKLKEKAGEWIGVLSRRG
jgi:hypothetical protein